MDNGIKRNNSLCSRRKTGVMGEGGTGMEGGGLGDKFPFFLAFFASPTPSPFKPGTQANETNVFFTSRPYVRGING